MENRFLVTTHQPT